MVMRNQGGVSRPKPKPQPKTQDVDIYELAQRANSTGSSKQIAQLCMIALGGIGIVSAVLFGPALVSAMSSPPVAKARSTPQTMMAMGHVSINMQRPDGVNTITKLDAFINQRCINANAIVSSEPQSVLRYGWPERKEPPVATMGLASAVNFLSCSTTVKLNRFCHPFYRKRFVYRIRDFLKVHAARRRRMAKIMANPQARTMMKMYEKVQEQIDAHPSNRRGTGKRRRRTGIAVGEGPLLPRSLAKAIAKLSKAGYLTSADFGNGWGGGSSVPVSLRPHIIASRGGTVCR